VARPPAIREFFELNEVGKFSASDGIHDLHDLPETEATFGWRAPEADTGVRYDPSSQPARRPEVLTLNQKHCCRKERVESNVATAVW
jgi:hypothetical protein